MTEKRREPLAQRGAAEQGPLFAYFLAGQKVGRLRGRNPRMGLSINTHSTQAKPDQTPNATTVGDPVNLITPASNTAAITPNITPMPIP